MNPARYRTTPIAPGFNLEAFDCGEAAYNTWLSAKAENVHRAGNAAVHLLIEDATPPTDGKVVGYYALAPTQIVRGETPSSVGRGGTDPTPGYLLAKMALDKSLRGDLVHQWGAQLLRQALFTILEAATAGGGRVIVVDADNEGPLPWYVRHGFRSTGVEGDLRLYMKVSTARKYLA